MERKQNTDRNGNNWSEDIKQAVWNKGKEIGTRNKDIYRADKCGHLILFTEHGNRTSNLGWEIDHVIPVAHDGSDDLTNLQPLYWENNVDKSDKLNWTCPVQ